MLQSLPSVPGKQPYITQYFLLLLERGKLNKHESIELARPALQQNRKDFIEKWLQEDKVSFFLSFFLSLSLSLSLS
jgi:clathrin heavy chain